MKEPVLDLQTSIKEAPRQDGVITLPGGYYAGDAVIPDGHHLEFSDVAHLKGSITIPAGGSLHGNGLFFSGGANRTAFHRLGDGSTVLNGEVRK